MTHLSIDEATAGSDSLSQVRADEHGVYWLARIALEDGRTSVRHWDGQQVRDLTPGANVRSRVMEYGGGAYDARGGLVVFCDDRTGHVTLLEDGATRPLTDGDPRFRHGGLHLVPERRLLVCVREDHAAEPEERTEIIALSLDETGPGRVLVTGADFYAGPAVLDGQLAWFQWMHPHMSWDSAEVLTCSLDDPSQLHLIAGGENVSNQHPMWVEPGSLAFTTDRDGYWNWVVDSPAGQLTRSVERDCDIPTWVLDQAPAGVVTTDLLAMTEFADGRGELVLWQPSTGATTRPLPGTAGVESVASHAEEIFAVVGWPDRANALVRVSPSGQVETLAGGEPMPGAVAPQSLWADSDAGPVQAFFYPVHGVERPPLLVMTHGGPTSDTEPSLDRQKQFWVSRGIAVLDVNYSGSTGFGRAYRDRLKGRWGVLDVADVVACVRAVTEAGLADGARVAIMGGSAGGYTTLQALVTSDVFAAGISSYGIGDLRTLATDTHKAESRYLDGLVGPWPEAEQLYLERSPITQLDQLRTPMLILQGTDDKEVPPNQAEALAAAVRDKGMPLALVMFEGEGHGFRSLAARREALASKLSFLQQVFAMDHADDVPVLPVENLA